MSAIPVARELFDRGDAGEHTPGQYEARRLGKSCELRLSVGFTAPDRDTGGPVTSC